MNSQLRTTLVVSVIASWVSISSMAAMPDPMPTYPESKGNYCIDDAIYWIKKMFGEQVKIRGAMLDKSAIPEKGVLGYHVDVWTDLCEDYFTFTYAFVPVNDCKRPQYYKRSQLVHMAGAMGSCRPLVPRMNYPKIDFVRGTIENKVYYGWPEWH